MLSQPTQENYQTKKIAALMEVYEKLPYLQQRVLQAKALLYDSSNKTHFYQSVVAALSEPNKKKLTYAELNAALDFLVNTKLLDKKYNCQRIILHRIAALALNSKNPYRDGNLLIIKRYPGYQDNPRFIREYQTLDNVRAVHVAVHCNTCEFLNYHPKEEMYYVMLLDAFITLFLDSPIDFNWLKTRSSSIQLYIVISQLMLSKGTKLPSLYKFWMTFYRNLNFQETNGADYISHLKAQMDIRFGLLARVKKQLLDQSTSPYSEAIQGALYLLTNRREEAKQCYDAALKRFKKLYDKRQWFMTDIHGILYLFLQIYYKNFTVALAAIQQIYRQQETSPDITFQAFEVLALAEIPNKYDDSLVRLRQLRLSVIDGRLTNFWDMALLHLAEYLLTPADAKNNLATLEDQFELSKEWHPLIAHLNAELIIAMQEKHSKALPYLEKSPFTPFRFLDLFQKKQPWEFKLQSLTALISNSSNKINERTSRLIWLLDTSSLMISPLEQTLTKNGQWSKGRPIALKHLFKRHSRVDYLSAQDLEVLKGLEESSGWYERDNYEWNIHVALPALIEHPLVFHQANPAVQIELVRGELELFIEEQEENYVFSLSKIADRPGIYLEQESPYRYRVIKFSEKAVEISRVITSQGLRIPKSAKEAVLQMIQSPDAQIKLNLDLAEDNLPTMESDPIPCLQLLPVNDGLKLSLWVSPFGQAAQGAYYHPGEGKETIVATVKIADTEQRYKTIRNLKAEKTGKDKLLRACPVLEKTYQGGNHWHLNETELCLELLYELEQYQQICPSFRMEWPKGKSFQLKKSVSDKDIHLSITSNQQWFEYDAEIMIDDGRVLQLQTLLSLLNSSPGRFIEIEKGQFIALTNQFKKQLQELQTMSEGNRIYHLNASILKELTEQFEDVSFDEGWQNHINKLEAMEKHQPEIPTTLQANLRDYQVEGFHYLSRLAHWGIGACLADDMGLGKTVQAIAFLLEQAEKGPSLVIAPTSVCFNWCDELVKFAPSLRVHILPSQDRATLIESLREFDVLISSYGLLLQEEAVFLEKKWQVIILDEAQAIKNNTTQRWKVATALKGACRIALTGTPIENHLGELWSIFRFLNPGLLSSLKSFQQRYSLPIEKYQDETARRALKKCVQPYILRRLKSAVLTELPPKTEQTILIEPTPEERAFYEAVRKQALEQIAKADTFNKKRFTILAEILKLRQACCDSTLLPGNIKLENSKIKTFLSLTESLKENNHKALVFSQFVRYLAIIREHLDKNKFKYQYIDGETPAKKRQQAVLDFQSGKGDLFLLSLKAGGTGLNLTSADYVIHLDPWWNPAVEDQASDRAHRIGQLRPVTIYRLIMQDSIEQKIINLHGQKRDLASDLLSGSDVSGKLSEEDLIQLMGD